MDKVKIKNLISNNKKKTVMTLAIILISILLVGIIVYAATNTENYVVDVQKDGSDNIEKNAESSITKQIVENSEDSPRTLTYEVKFNNFRKRSRPTEVVVLVDNSKSMNVNDDKTLIKSKATEFVQNLHSSTNDVELSIVSNDKVVYGRTNIHTANTTVREAIFNSINTITEGVGSSLNNGIELANTTYSNRETDKFLVIFSDATDSILEEMTSLVQNKNINAYSILTDITNNEYQENTEIMGKYGMISNITDFSYIYDKINESLTKVKITDTFTQEVNDYFDFKVISKDDSMEVTKTDTGYVLNISQVKANETKTLKFKLTLKDNANIDSRKAYTELNTSDNLKVEYTVGEDNRSYDMKLSPTFIICDKYSLTIQSVSDKNDKLPVKDLDVKVVGTDEEGKEIYNKTLKTDANGKIKIDSLKKTGDITFEIKPLVNQIGYSETSATTIKVHNNPSARGITAEADVGEEPIVNNNTRNIDVKLPIKTQEFDIVVDLQEENNSNIKLGNVEFRLIQPKLNSKYEMDALYGTTDANGRLVFHPTVMTKDGTYEYILSQMTDQEGYDSMGNVTLVVKFENGKIAEKGFTKKYNNNVEATRITPTEGRVTVKVASENADTFRLEINVTDSVNSNKKLEGAVYNIEVTRMASNGNQVTNTINGCSTDEYGQIKLDLPGKGNIQVKITEVRPATGYQADGQTKELVFTRKDGRVQSITYNPQNVDAEPDPDANTLVVNLTSIERTEKNRIQIHMIDNDERDINLPGVGLTLVNLVTNKTYTANTDINGIANFLVDDEVAGIYVYDIMLTNGLPYGYINSENKLGSISVHFRDDKFIDECSDTTVTVPYFATDCKFMEEGEYAYHTGLVEIGLKPDDANTSNLQVKLVNDSDNAIEGAKYDITIESGEVIRKITGRQTDENGMLTTRLVGKDKVIITIKETETIKGHIINTQEQIIELTKINGQYQMRQEPYEYDGNEQKIGAEIVENNIIYHDINKEKTGNNTILNLYVNKIDINNFKVDNVKTVITSPTLKLGGSVITEGTNYSATAKSGNVFTLNPAVTDINGYFEIEGIEVNGLELNDGERVDYLYMYEIDVNGNKVPNTDITLKLTFRFNENKGIIQITNVEATWGNRLISKRTFDGYETNVAYESNVYLDIYTNYDDVGNFSLDLSKTDKDNNALQGAKYDVIVTRLDGTRLIRRGVEVTDSVEFSGFLVAAGTKIEITEVEAPIGYELNEYTEILEIKSIDVVTGKIELELEESSYKTPRADLKPVETLILEDGTYKTCATIQLINYELDTFKFGITTKDINSLSPVAGYKFEVSSDRGAQARTESTDNEGKTTILVGANYAIEDYVVTYKVENIKAGDYYKKLSSPIEVKVVFDLNGEVKGEATVEANKTSTGYGTIWEIEKTKTIDGNDIDILIKVEPQEKLIVNVQTEDVLSKEQLTNVEYEITPSITKATGTTRMEVGYVLPEGNQKYTIKQTNNINDYIKISDKSFQITYDVNGDISTQVPPTASSEGISIVSYNGKEITIKIEIEPEVPFVITNKAFFGESPLSNSKFEITSEKGISKTSTTDLNGNAISYVGEFAKAEEEIIYTVKQTSVPQGYALVPEFKVKVTYDSNRNITNAQMEGNVNDNLTFVTVTKTQPSTESDLGYRGNSNGIVNIEVKNYPEVQFNIQNLDKRDGTTILYGAVYEVTSTIPTKEDGAMVDETGIAVAHLDRGAFNTTIEYTLKELNPSPRYQTMLADAIIEVDFDANGFIVNTPRVTKLSDIVSASIPNQLVQEDKFKVDIKVLSNPKLAINISKIDEENNLPLANVEFEITARIQNENLSNFTEEVRDKITLNSGEITEEQYLSQVLDRLKIDPEDVQTIKQTLGIENLINDLKANGNLTEEEENQIKTGINNTDKINRIVNLEKSTKTKINQYISKITNRNVIDKLISDNKTTEDRVNAELTKVKNLVRISSDVITTDSNGNAIGYMNKTLENKTIEYTIKETRKADGYNWQDEPIIIEITYDETGKMITNNPIKVVSGDISIDRFDVNNFLVETTIKNEPSDEIRIHLTVEDTYDSRKKLETAEFDAYLVDTTNGISYTPDNKYRVNLASGSVTSSTGKVTAHGEDTESMGIYEEGAGNRILRLEQKKTPDKYYLGDVEYQLIYQSIRYQLLVNVEFNDEGSVVSTSVYNPGGDTRQIGFVADQRYIVVSNTRNTINVTIKYYPSLQIQMVAKDMYTNEALEAKYAISTVTWGGYDGTNRIKSGYINPHFYGDPDYWQGNKHHIWEHPQFGSDYEENYTTDSKLDTISGDIHELYGAEAIAWGPTEADNIESINIDTRERTFYIYERKEPTSPMQYQKYQKWHIGSGWDYLIATVNVKYDEVGKIQDVKFTEKSSNNIKNNFMEIKISEDGYTLQVTVKYVPITTVTATVVDEVTGKGLSGIRIMPYVNKTEVTERSHEYRTQFYYTTGSNGVTGWTYWGGSIAGGQVRYEMDSYTVGSGYNGYFDPGNIILDVAYDENGRVIGATPRNTDSYGDINAINISWENNDIKITIPYSRKFNVKLNKVDYYDNNTKLGAVFNVTSSEGATESVVANSTNAIGKVYPGKTVRYTVSETTAPNGYVPVNNLDFYVTFNNDGTVRNTSSESDYYKFVKSAEVDLDVNRVNKTDLEANIKNKPRFNVSIELTDKFYPTLKLQGATFEMTNSKGDSAQGEVVTDKNGILETYIGPIYPGEEVEYTVRQTGEVNGYYPNTTEIRFKVKFNESGRIESYELLSGSGIATIDPNKHVNTKGIHLSITNMPKNLKVGVYKYDELTNEAMDLIKFNVKVEEVGKVDKNSQVVTNANGSVAGVVDTFVESSDYRIVKYTISEIEVPNSYRKIQDVVIQVTFNKDGSMFLYDVLSNESNVGVEVATNGQIRYEENEEKTPVHIKLTIPNDNKYDLIIKNEDKNYEGLGVEGTVYDVTINGEELQPTATNANGITKIVNRTEVGDIAIKITERDIGEGYRADNTNDATILIHKGEETYSLALDETELTNKGYTFTSTTNDITGDIIYQIVIAQTIVEDQIIDTILTLTVNENYGTISATFKNETKLELKIAKDDINTKEALEGAIFAITSEEIDNRGNTVADTLQTITNTKVVTVTNDDGTISQAYQIDENEKTNNEGLLSFDLGLAHQNKTIKYTLVEVKAPEGYSTITPISVTVKFDAYGRITEITDDSFRAECYLDSNTGKSHNMTFNISNGTIDPQYTVKVVSEDSQTGTRINGSIFQVEITNSEGSTYKEVTGTTRDVSRTVGNKTFVAEKGVMKVTGIDLEGDITISLNQVETATGYVYGSNKVAGKVLANAKFTVVTSELEKELELSVDQNSVFEVSVDNTNREIIIKVKNDPELTFDITKIDGKTKQKLANAEFTVTSVIQTSATTTPTTLEEKSPLTDENGHTTLNGGIIEAGRTIIYTLKENKMQGYDRLDDIVILVQYDTKGNIMYYEILSDVNDVKILENGDAKITETKRVLGASDVPGKVEVEYQTYQIPTGLGTKILQLQISNKLESANQNGKYEILLEKHHIDDSSYPYLIPGVTFEISVSQEYGKAQTTWIDTTDENGIIMSPSFEGYGYITITIKEIATIDGFKLDTQPKIFKLKRDKDTKKLEIVSLYPENIGYKFSEDNTKVILKPVNEVATNTYGMVINKVDKNSNVLIANNPAEFEITRIEKYDNLTPVENEETGEITYESEVQEIKQPILKQSTDESGRIVVNNLIAPEEGTYRYVIKETKAPEGYIEPTEDMELDITFAKNAADELIMTNVEVIKGNDKLKVAKAKEQLLNLIILNTNEKNIVQDGEYKFNIVKVDNENNAITTSAAIFKLTDTQTNEVNYYETDEQGMLSIGTFKMPEEEGKYIYKLNEVKAPNGYILNVNDIMLELEFAKDEEGKMYLKDVQVQGDNIAYEAPKEGKLPDTTITIKVTNEEGGNGTGNTNDKRYTFVLNKVDALTKEIITENVEFEVMLANGEIVKGKTNDNGQLRIEDVFMPAQPGKYELVIKEKTTPSGYKVDEEPKNVKVTFTGYGENMVISDITLGETNNKNIEILQDKCTDQYVEVNILNEKENPELYVISKEDSKGNDIYDVLKGYDVTKKQYKIDKPFIDTKVAKYGGNVTAQEFINNLESNGHMVVLDKDGKEIAPNARVKTGMTLKSTLGSQELTFTIIVKGDINGDGRVTTVDLNTLISHLSVDKVLTDPIKLRATDLNNDGRITTVDLNKTYAVHTP